MPAANARVEMNRQAIGDLLRSDAVLNVLREKGDRIGAAAGPGHEVDPEIGRNRARVSIRTATVEAMIAEAYDHNLTRALDAGR